MSRPFSRYVSRLMLTLGFTWAAPLSLHAAAPGVLLEDNFATLNQNLGPQGGPTGTVTAKNNALQANVAPKSGLCKVYQSTVLGDFDASIRVRLSTFGAGVGAQAGLTFWCDQPGAYYALVVDDQGRCAVRRIYADDLYEPVTFRSAPGFKAAAGEWVELRVLTHGAVATVFVNGVKLTSFKGRPSDKGTTLGVFASGGAKPATAEFSTLKVVAPTDPAPADVTPNSDALIFGFKPDYVDPAWGVQNKTFFQKGDVFVITPKPKETQWELYRGEGSNFLSVDFHIRFPDIGEPPVPYTGAATSWKAPARGVWTPKFRLAAYAPDDAEAPPETPTVEEAPPPAPTAAPSGPVAPTLTDDERKNRSSTGTGAGIVFWVPTTENPNMYMFLVFDDGTFKVSRRLNDAWEDLIPRQRLPGAAADVDLHEYTPMSVVTGTPNATFYVNRFKVGEVRSHTAPPESMFGLVVQAIDVPLGVQFQQVMTWRVHPITGQRLGRPVGPIKERGPLPNFRRGR